MWKGRRTKMSTALYLYDMPVMQNMKVTPFIDDNSNILPPNQAECAFMGENMIFQEKSQFFICIKT